MFWAPVDLGLFLSWLEPEILVSSPHPPSPLPMSASEQHFPRDLKRKGFRLSLLFNLRALFNLTPVGGKASSFSHLRELSSVILWSFVTKVLKLQTFSTMCMFFVCYVSCVKGKERSREVDQGVMTLLGPSRFNMWSLRREIRAEAFKLNNIVWTLIIA